MTVDVDEIIRILRDLGAGEVRTAATFKKNQIMYRVEVCVKEVDEEDPKDD